MLGVALQLHRGGAGGVAPAGEGEAVVPGGQAVHGHLVVAELLLGGEGDAVDVLGLHGDGQAVGTVGGAVGQGDGDVPAAAGQGQPEVPAGHLVGPLRQVEADGEGDGAGGTGIARRSAGRQSGGRSNGTERDGQG